MIVPERINRQGRLVPSFQIDEEFADPVLAYKWSLHSCGYMQIGVNGKTVLLHRFVWELRYGEAPPCIDHINRDPRDNRICNLRVATQSLNMRNTRSGTTNPNRSGLPRGVRVSRDGKKFVASVSVKSRPKHLGTFDTPQDASEAFEKARAEMAAQEEVKARQLLITPKESAHV
jgi:hypothetical protein